MQRNLNLFAGLILALLGAIVAYKGVTGGLALYVHPRYTTLLTASGVLLVALGLLLGWLPELRMSPTLLLLPSLVLVMALLVPARPLGASLVAGKQLSPTSSDALIKRWQTQRSADSRTWTLLEWTAALQSDGPASLAGRPARFEGFVFRDEGTGAGEVRVGRYVVTCCTADGTALSLVVRAPGADDLRLDQWVVAEGTLKLDEEKQPYIDGTLTPAETPRSPYLYP